MKKNKIVVLTSQAFSLINFRKKVLELLIESGAEVYTLAPNYSEFEYKELKKIGVIPIPVSFSRTLLNPFVLFSELIRLVVKIRIIKPDVVLSYFIKPVTFGNIAAKLCGVKKFFSIIEGLGSSRRMLVHKESVYSKSLIFLYKISLKRVNKIFFLQCR